MAMLLPQLVLASVSANDASPAAICEMLAGHPYEPGHGGVGVDSKDINAPAAVRACEDALAAAPDDVPTQFRLARSLLRLKACSDGLEMMHTAAEAGYAPAQAAFGAEFLGPQCGAQRDLAMAFTWAEKAALKGNPVGQTNLAFLYECGCLSTRDHAAALHWYRTAADQGYAPALRNLASYYAAGDGIPRDPEEAKRLYRLAADKGDDLAATGLAGLLLAPEDGDPSLEDIQQGVDLLNTAVANGTLEAFAMLGRWSDHNGDYDRARELFTKCKNAGAATCWYEVGLMAERGHGVTADARVAMEYFRGAAELGLVDAMIKIGRVYITTKLAEFYDPALGEQWLLRAASLGSPTAMITLGDHYFHDGGSVDQAIALYQMAAEGTGSVEGYEKLAELYSMLGDIENSQAAAEVVVQQGDAGQRQAAQSVLDALDKMRAQRMRPRVPKAL